MNGQHLDTIPVYLTAFYLMALALEVLMKYPRGAKTNTAGKLRLGV